MAILVWSAQSREDLDSIHAFIARDAPLAADRFIARVFKSADRLAAFPFSGAVVPEFKREEIREILCGNYRLIYHAAADRVEILTVYHGARLLDPDLWSD
jgi:plasmid stabilization system protein ParE